MEISLAGIEQAVDGLGYRSEKSLKYKLLYTIRNRHLGSGTMEEAGAIDNDALIDIIWELGGDKAAIRAKRKNLNSIRSSVNADLDTAWEDGRNPEGITIGPLNTFTMSDAAKDKILSSFGGAVNLDGGDSLDRVTEALKIVSEYLSNLPEGLKDDTLSNLKSLVDGLAEKFSDGGGPGEFEIVGKDGAGEEGAGEIEEDYALIEEEIVEENPEAYEFDDTETVEGIEEENDLDEEEVDFMDEEELLENDKEIEGTVEEDLDDYEELIEDDLETIESDDTEIVEVDEEDDIAEEPDDGELLDDEEILGDEDNGEELIEEGTEFDEVTEDDMEIVEVEGEDDIAEEPDDVDEENADDVEIVTEEGEDALLETDEIDGFEELESEDTEIVEVEEEDDIAEEPDDVDEENADDVEIVTEEGEDALLETDEIDDSEELESDDTEVVEVEEEDDIVEEADEIELADDGEILEEDMDAEEIDEADILEEEDLLEEADEEEGEDNEDDIEPDGENNEDDLGLPLDQLPEEPFNFDEFQPDEEQKRLLAERFDGYLGAMERFYNQYIIIERGRYKVGADGTEADVLTEQTVSIPELYMGKYPVTNALFEVFIERTGYRTTAEKLGYGYVYQGRYHKTVDPQTGLTKSVWNPSHRREKVAGATWYQPTGPGSTLHQKRNHPVVQVSIKDARTFAAWTGKRLPTEIEWEAAARTRSGFLFPWGNEWQDGFCNSENSALSDTSPVDAFPKGKNETGLADLLGNVLEWTASECEPKYPMENPARFFIARGGSWISHEKTMLFERTRFGSEFTANILGFRCMAD